MITGGSRGLGIELARWAADRGAMNLLCLSGSGDVPEKSQLLIKSIEAAHPGINIKCAKCDVRDLAQVEKLFTETSPAITSVFHAANLYSTALKTAQR